MLYDFSNSVLRLTVTGLAGTIYNGVSDWLYEEEILGQTAAVFLSPRATKMAFMSFNDSEVELHTMKSFSRGRSPAGKDVKFRYPQAGSDNPVVTVYVQSLRQDGVSESIRVKPPAEVENM